MYSSGHAGCSQVLSWSHNLQGQKEKRMEGSYMGPTEGRKLESRDANGMDKREMRMDRVRGGRKKVGLILAPSPLFSSSSSSFSDSLFCINVWGLGTTTHTKKAEMCAKINLAKALKKCLAVCIFQFYSFKRFGNRTYTSRWSPPPRPHVGWYLNIFIHYHTTTSERVFAVSHFLLIWLFSLLEDGSCHIVLYTHFLNVCDCVPQVFRPKNMSRKWKLFKLA